MKIEILGTGCYNCIKLETLIDAVAEQVGATSFEIERVTDESQVLQYMPLELNETPEFKAFLAAPLKRSTTM